MTAAVVVRVGQWAWTLHSHAWAHAAGQPRPLREILTAATAPSKAGGLGARQWVYRKFTVTVAPASYTGRRYVTQKTSAAPYPCAGSLPPSHGHSRHAPPAHLSALQNGHPPFNSKEVQGIQLTAADDRVRLLADTRFTRKLTAANSAFTIDRHCGQPRPDAFSAR